MKQCYQFDNNNEWYTFKSDVLDIIEYLNLPKDQVIWCPFDLETSNFVIEFRKAGYKVIASHILDGKDFFEYEPEEHYDWIISNPPFNQKSKFMERLLKLNKNFLMIYGIQCFNSGGFTRLFKDYNDLFYVFLPKRIKFWKGEIEPEKPVDSPTFHSMWIGRDLSLEQNKLDFYEKDK